MFALLLLCGLAQTPGEAGQPADGKGPFAFSYFLGNGEDGLERRRAEMVTAERGQIVPCPGGWRQADAGPIDRARA